MKSRSEQIQEKKDAIAAITKEQIGLITSLSNAIVKQYRKHFIARCNRKPKVKKIVGIMAVAFKTALKLRSLEIQKQMMLAAPIPKEFQSGGMSAESGFAIVGVTGCEKRIISQWQHDKPAFSNWEHWEKVQGMVDALEKVIEQQNTNIDAATKIVNNDSPNPPTQQSHP